MRDTLPTANEFTNALTFTRALNKAIHHAQRHHYTAHLDYVERILNAAISATSKHEANTKDKRNANT